MTEYCPSSSQGISFSSFLGVHKASKHFEPKIVPWCNSTKYTGGTPGLNLALQSSMYQMRKEGREQWLIEQHPLEVLNVIFVVVNLLFDSVALWFPTQYSTKRLLEGQGLSKCQETLDGNKNLTEMLINLYVWLDHKQYFIWMEWKRPRVEQEWRVNSLTFFLVGVVLQVKVEVL